MDLKRVTNYIKLMEMLLFFLNINNIVNWNRSKRKRVPNKPVALRFLACLFWLEKNGAIEKMVASKESAQRFITLIISSTSTYTLLVHQYFMSSTLRFHHILFNVWLLWWYTCVVCKFQFEKHNFPCKYMTINLSINLLKFYLSRFHLTNQMKSFLNQCFVLPYSTRNG